MNRRSDLEITFRHINAMSSNGHADVANPIDPDTTLKPNVAPASVESLIHPQKAQEDEDSAVTKAEKFERHAASEHDEEHPSKRVKLEPSGDTLEGDPSPTKSERQKGVAPIKPESVCLRQNILSPGLTLYQVPRASTWYQERQKCYCCG